MTRPTETEADATLLSASHGGDRQISRWLRDRLHAARGPIIGATLFGTLHGYLLIPQAWLVAGLIAGLLVEDVRVQEHQALFWLAAVMLLRVACSIARDTLAARAGIQVAAQLHGGLLRHLFTLGPAGLRRFDSGQLSSAALDQCEAVNQYAARYRPQLAIAILVPLGLLLAVFSQDWLAGLLLLFAAPLIPLFMALVGMGAAAASQRQFRALARLSGLFLDRLQGLATLKHFGRADAAAAALQSGADDYRRRTMAVLRIAFLSSAVLEFFSAVAIAMLAIYIGLGLLGFFTLGPAPGLTLHTGLFILLLAPDYFAPLRDLAAHYHDRAAAVGAAAELRPLWETPAVLPSRGTRRLGAADAITLEVSKLAVRYGDGPVVLEDIDFCLEPGDALLISGASGSGKSSLLYAVAGLLRPAAGAVRINGCPLSELALGEWERHLGWLGQQPHLVPGTIRENILLAAPRADTRALQRAADEAGVSRFAAALPAGLDTPVGERGVGLSGGEAQRVALARAILRRPRLLLLDEPTASLDPESRSLLIDALRRLHVQGTGLLVATHDAEAFPWIPRRLALSPQGGGS